MQPDQKPVRNVAILMNTATSWSRSLIKGILNYTNDHERWNIYLKPQQNMDRIELPKNWKGDGIIARVYSERIAADLNELNLPVVNVSRIPVQNAHFPRVVNDNDAHILMVIETLRSRGFRRFAFAGNMQEYHEAEHYNTFEVLLEQEGYEKPYLYSPHDSGDLEDWLRQLPKPIAIHCWSALMGHEVINACLNANISIPHDVAVLTATYDELMCEASNPPLAGMLISTEQIGMKAAMLLDDMMHGKTPEKTDWQLLPKGVKETPSIDTLAVDDPRMAEVMTYIQTHCLEPLTVPDVLKANPMARRSLERKFRNYFGCSIAKHIERLRTQHARMLLSETDEPITLVAEKCCFSSYNQLHQVFKRNTGISPGKYRKQFR